MGPSSQSISPAPRPLTPTAPPLSSPAFTPSNNLYGYINERKGKILDDEIYELPDDPPKLELGDGVSNALGPGAEDIRK